jgi:hypothetical protein
VTLSEQTVQDYARRAVENPFEMEYEGDYPLFDTWGLSPFSHHGQCSQAQDEAFHDLSRRLTKEHPEDFAIEAFDHYAMEWVEFLLVRVYDDQGAITPAFMRCLDFLDEWNTRLAAEPVEEPLDPLPEEPEEDIPVLDPIEDIPDGTDIARDVLYPVFVRFGNVNLDDQESRFDLARDLKEALDAKEYQVPLNYLAYVLDDPRIRSTNLATPGGVTTVVDFLAVEIAPYTGERL